MAEKGKRDRGRKEKKKPPKKNKKEKKQPKARGIRTI